MPVESEWDAREVDMENEAAAAVDHREVLRAQLGQTIGFDGRPAVTAMRSLDYLTASLDRMTALYEAAVVDQNERARVLKALRAIVATPSADDLLNNAVARAMHTIATLALKEME